MQSVDTGQYGVDAGLSDVDVCLKCDDTYTRVGGGGSRVFNVGGGA